MLDGCATKTVVCFQKFHASLDKVQDGLHSHPCSAYTSPLGLTSHHHSGGVGVGNTHSGANPLGSALHSALQYSKHDLHSNISGGTHLSQSLSQHDDTAAVYDKDSQLQLQQQQQLPPQPKDTQFLSANCVIMSYFDGSVTSQIDEHFSRSLSQTASSSSTSSSASSSCAAAESSSKSASWRGEICIREQSRV